VNYAGNPAECAFHGDLLLRDWNYADSRHGLPAHSLPVLHVRTFAVTQILDGDEFMTQVALNSDLNDTEDLSDVEIDDMTDEQLKVLRGRLY
jgi:hypothetical protein